MSQNSKGAITTNRFVAFLDILGFKEMVTKESPEFVYEKVKNLRHVVKTVIDGTLETMPMTTNLKSFSFSDSVFIFSKDDSPQALLTMIHQIRIVLGVCCGEKIALKGAMSCGSVTIDIDNAIFFGKPVNDSYALHEELQMFGIILDHNVESKIKEFSKNEEYRKEMDFETIQYKTPTKSGKMRYYCIYWPSVELPHPMEETGHILFLHDRNKVEDFYTTASGHHRVYVENTMEFIDHLIKLAKTKYPGIRIFNPPKRTKEI